MYNDIILDLNSFFVMFYILFALFLLEKFYNFTFNRHFKFVIFISLTRNILNIIIIFAINIIKILNLFN